MAADYVTEIEVKKDQATAWKRTGISVLIDGSGSEGIVCSARQTVSAPFAYGYFMISVGETPSSATVDLWVF